MGYREVLDSFGIAHSSGGRIRRGARNAHWIVRTDRECVVLRRYASECTLAEVGYELTVLRHLAARDWPVPSPLAEPLVQSDGIWCVFSYLHGRALAPRSETGIAAEQRERGRLLARLHADLAPLAALGQRDGWLRTDEGLFARKHKRPVADALREFARRDPETSRLLSEYRDRCAERLAALIPAAPAPIVIHGDIAPWNMRYVRRQLTGLFDFEYAHLDLRVADFALSWRGKHQGVLVGYQQESPLAPIEAELVIPIFWAWMIACAVSDIEDGDGDPSWAVSHLVRQQHGGRAITA